MVPQTLVWALRALPLLAGVALLVGALMAYTKQKVSSPYGVVPSMLLIIAGIVQLAYGYSAHPSAVQLFVVAMADVFATLIIAGGAYHMLRTLRMTALGLLYGGLALLCLNMTLDTFGAMYVMQHKANVPVWVHVMVLTAAAFVLVTSFMRWANHAVTKVPQPH